MPDIALLVDDFDNGAIDDPPWGDSGGGAAETGGGVEFPCVAAFSFMDTVTQDYDLSESGIFGDFSEVPDAGTGTVISQGFLALRTLDGDAESLRIGFDNGQMFGQYVNAGPSFNTIFTAAYSATDDRWWRITHTGTTVTMWTSPDGSDWTDRGSVGTGTLDFAITLLDVHVICGQFGGTEQDLGQLRVESINVSPLQQESGGSATTVTVSATGGGVAAPGASGGSTATVTVAAAGAGSPGHSGGSEATVTVTATGAGEAGGLPVLLRQLLVELFLDGAWRDVTTDVRQGDPVTVTRGRSGEGSRVQPSQCRFTLHDPDGDYNPRNTLGQWFGFLGRNTPIRVGIHSNTPLVEDFEDDDIAFTFNAGDSDATWFRDDSTAATGTWSLQSSAIVPGDTSDAVIDVPMGATSLTFSYLVLSTAGVNRLRFLIDGVEVFNDSGNTGWLESGPHDMSAATTVTMRWEETSGGGGEQARVDDLVFTNAAAVRFAGELSRLTPRWDTSHADRRVEVEAGGLLRRLERSTAPLRSALFRYFTTNQGSLHSVAYWPIEDGRDSAQPLPAVGDDPMVVTSSGTNSIDFGQSDDFIASDPIAVVDGDGRMVGDVPAYVDTSGVLRAVCLVSIPSGGVASALTRVLDLLTDGSGIQRWSVFVNPDGDLRLVGLTFPGGATVFDTGDIVFAMNGLPRVLTLLLEQDGSDVDWALNTVDVDGSFGGTSDIEAGTTVGAALEIQVGAFSPADSLDGVAFGHAAVQAGGSAALDSGLVDALRANAGETAAARMTRLAREENLELFIKGEPGDTEPVGPQPSATLLNALNAAAAADGGVLYETRGRRSDRSGNPHFLSLTYRTRAGHLDQAAKLALDYAAGDVAPPLLPVEDDKHVRNEVTVARPRGGEVTVTQTVGALNTAEPPDGVGRYEFATDLNVNSDSQLQAAAEWLLGLGTVDEARFPRVRVDLAADPEQTAAAFAVDINDRVTIDNAAEVGFNTQISLLAHGSTETLRTAFSHDIVYHCEPESPYQTAP